MGYEGRIWELKVLLRPGGAGERGRGIHKEVCSKLHGAHFPCRTRMESRFSSTETLQKS